MLRIYNQFKTNRIADVSGGRESVEEILEWKDKRGARNEKHDKKK